MTYRERPSPDDERAAARRRLEEQALRGAGAETRELARAERALAERAPQKLRERVRWPAPLSRVVALGLCPIVLVGVILWACGADRGTLLVVAIPALFMSLFVGLGLDGLLVPLYVRRELRFWATRPFPALGFEQLLGSTARRATITVSFADAAPERSVVEGLLGGVAPGLRTHADGTPRLRLGASSDPARSTDLRLELDLDYGYKEHDELRSLLRALMRSVLQPIHEAYPIARAATDAA